MRSEYVCSSLSEALRAIDPPPPWLRIRAVRREDREALASLLLDAYRGTPDDEGEGDQEALAAIDDYFSRMLWRHSVVLDEGGCLTAMSFVVDVSGRHYIDPVATAASRKGAGRGRAVVLASLRSLAADGVGEVGATITDGNTPSERLFAGLRFERVRPWG
jgi:hypothetical protein